MTVEQLIEELRKHPRTATVVGRNGGDYYDPGDVYKVTKEDDVPRGTVVIDMDFIEAEDVE